jgi:hypothetical protein
MLSRMSSMEPLLPGWSHLSVLGKVLAEGSGGPAVLWPTGQDLTEIEQ